MRRASANAAITAAARTKGLRRLKGPGAPTHGPNGLPMGLPRVIPQSLTPASVRKLTGDAALCDNGRRNAGRAREISGWAMHKRLCRPTAGNKQLTLRMPEGTVEPLPIIYLNVFQGDGGDVWAACRELDCPPFVLAAIGGLDWNRELSPWECDATVRDGDPFAGGASAYLAELIEQIVPDVETLLPRPPAWRGIAGYSLAGLFALWSLWQTDAFDRAASASGSLWFPRFLERAAAEPFAGSPRDVYLSLGKKETKTPNRMMRHVLEDTRAMEELLRGRGIDTTLELNPGNHFSETDRRMARGIKWLLGR